MTGRRSRHPQRRKVVPHHAVAGPPRSLDRPTRLRGWLLAAAVVVAVICAYRPAWNGQPLWDDDGHMTKPELRSAAGLVRIWTEIGATQQYYPLVHSVFWVEHRLFGDATTGYHVVSILLHALSSLLVVAVLRTLGLRGAWLGGWLFALHPVMVESVAWITELKNTLSGVFFLAAALSYLAFDRERDTRPVLRSYALALGLFICGLLSKTVVATLPAALLVVVWWRRGRIDLKRDVAPLAPFFVLGAGAGLVTAWVERTFIGAAGSEFSLAPLDRLLIAGRATWFYLFKLVWPANLTFIYPRWNIDPAAAWQYLFPLAFLLALALSFRWRHRSRAPLATLLYFAATLFPALGFFNVYPFRYSFVADHFQYLAAIGPIAAAAAGLTMGLSLLGERLRGVARIAVPGVLLPVFFLLTWNQSGTYANGATLYETTLRRNPECWMAHYNLGILLATAGQLQEARSHYLEALKLKPDHAKAHVNLGVVLARLNRVDEALAHYQKALELRPNAADAHYNLGFLLASLGRTEEAQVRYLRALELEPAHAAAHNNLGLLLADMGRSDEAAVHYGKAIDADPGDPQVHQNLGLLLLQQGRFDEALVHLQQAVAINPTFAQGHNDLGSLLAKMGRLDEATIHFRRAVELRPDDLGLLRNLALALARKGERTEAVAVLQRALGLARAAGDRAQAETIGQFLAKVAGP